MVTKKYIGVGLFLLSAVMIAVALSNIGVKDVGPEHVWIYVIIPTLLGSFLPVLGALFLFAEKNDPKDNYDTMMADVNMREVLEAGNIRVVDHTVYLEFYNLVIGVSDEFVVFENCHVSFSRITGFMEEINRDPAFFTHNDEDWWIMGFEGSRCHFSQKVTGTYTISLCRDQDGAGFVYHFDLGNYQVICDDKLNQVMVFQKHSQ
jgi:hypothetical protein